MDGELEHPALEAALAEPALEADEVTTLAVLETDFARLDDVTDLEAQGEKSGKNLR